jgi:enoyl-CoA hydratase/carnithine racemase
MLGKGQGAEVIYQKQGSRATLVLSNPAKRNPLSSSTAKSLAECLRRADDDNDVRVIVITGAGEAFSAGADLSEFRSMLESSATEVWDNGADWGDLYTLIPKLGTPVIARVDGPAIAGACGLICCCDFALASTRSSFAIPEIRIGLFALFILPALLEAVGPRVARELVLTGRSFDAEEAQRLGVVNRAVDAQSLDTAVDELVRDLTAIEPAAMRRGKHAFRAIQRADAESGIELARALRSAFLASDELRAGVTKFLKPRD